jgi:hypothetical protein
MRGTASRRWLWLAILAVAAGLAVVTVRALRAPPAPAADQIDDASKEALREILRQEEE